MRTAVSCINVGAKIQKKRSQKFRSSRNRDTAKQSTKMKETKLNKIHEGEQPFKCNVCDAIFHQKTALKSHVASDHEGNCANSVQKNFLKTYVHEVKKPFKCDIFDARFAQKIDMKSHVVASGGVKEGEKPLKCNTCDCEFNRHLTKAHDGKQFHQLASNVHEGENLETHDQKLLSNTTAEGNKFQCPICLKFFSSKYSVKDHICPVHDGKINKFECSTCF